LALCSLENKDARARFGILKGLRSARRGREPRCTRTAAQRDNHPTGARTGCVVTAGTRRRGHESRKDARARGAPEGLDSTRALTRPRARTSTRGTSPGSTRRAAPSKRNSESSGRSRRDRSANDGLRLPCSPQKRFTQGVKGGHSSAGIRERSSSQCSTG
jgi:hypothetical protein